VAGATYEIKVIVEDALMTVYIDGVAVATAPLEPQTAVANAAVYVGDPWYAAAKVTLSDLCLKEIVTSCVEIKFQAPHAIDAMLSS
jgi:hypothetical protein